MQKLGFKDYELNHEFLRKVLYQNVTKCSPTETHPQFYSNYLISQGITLIVVQDILIVV